MLVDEERSPLAIPRNHRGEGFLPIDCCSGIPPNPEDLGAAYFSRTSPFLTIG